MNKQTNQIKAQTTRRRSRRQSKKEKDKTKAQLNITTLTRIANQENDYDREAGLQQQDYKLANDNAGPAENKYVGQNNR